MGANSGMRDPTVCAVSWLPVAAPISAGARLMNRELRSGPEGREAGREVGGGRRGGGGGGSSVVPDLSSPPPWSQQKESEEHECVSPSTLAGAAQRLNIVLGIQTPGHDFFLGGGGAGLRKGRVLRGGGGRGFCAPGLGFGGRSDLVRQHRALPGQIADRSISSQSREKKPVTQVPLHRFSGGIGILSTLGFSFSSSSLLVVSFSFSFLSFLEFTTWDVVLSAVFISSSSSSFSSSFSFSFSCFSFSTSFSFFSSSPSVASSSVSLPLLQRASCLGMTSSLGVSVSVKIFLATQQRRSGAHRAFTSKMASQKHEIRSATHTPGHSKNRQRIHVYNNGIYIKW